MKKQTMNYDLCQMHLQLFNEWKSSWGLIEQSINNTLDVEMEKHKNMKRKLKFNEQPNKKPNASTSFILEWSIKQILYCMYIR